MSSRWNPSATMEYWEAQSSPFLSGPNLGETLVLSKALQQNSGVQNKGSTHGGWNATSSTSDEYIRSLDNLYLPQLPDEPFPSPGINRSFTGESGLSGYTLTEDALAEDTLAEEDAQDCTGGFSGNYNGQCLGGYGDDNNGHYVEENIPYPVGHSSLVGFSCIPTPGVRRSGTDASVLSNASTLVSDDTRHNATQSDLSVPKSKGFKVIPYGTPSTIKAFGIKLGTNRYQCKLCNKELTRQYFYCHLRKDHPRET